MQADGFGLVGTTIAEKYVVEAVADTGGTAIVYRAFHLPWKRAVALKVFRTPAYVDEASRAALLERFVLEGRILGELSERSSAVLQVCDIGTLTTSSGEWVPYMVLEWLEGATLEQVLEREVAAGLLLRELGQAVALLDPIAEALALAHRRGIVHRDVKPSNLLVVGDPRGPDVTLKLLDFGIAKVVEDAQQRGAYGTTGDREVTAFTPAYGAPEQFSFALGTTGPWTDVFALALVLLEIVSGQAPLPGDTIEELGRAATSTSLRPSLARLGKTRSADVEAVFARAVSVEPSRRYASVDLFWADLKQALDWPDMTKGDRATYDPLCNASDPQRRGMHPANCVSWAQAEAYCAAAGARLPTEAEWELAARGTDGRRYPWGDAEPTATRLNACGVECAARGKKRGVELLAMHRGDDGWPTTAPVGTFPSGASPYGVLDVTGNVWEWVRDRHGASDRGEARDAQGPEAGEQRVLRGGAWNGAESAWVRPTYRFRAAPTMKSHGIGFRCAKTLRDST